MFQPGNTSGRLDYCEPLKHHCNSCRDRSEIKMGYDQLPSQQDRIKHKQARWMVPIHAPNYIGVDDFLHNNGFAAPNFPPKTNYVERHKPRWFLRRFGVERYAWSVTGQVACLTTEGERDCVDNRNKGDGDLNFHVWDGTALLTPRGRRPTPSSARSRVTGAPRARRGPRTRGLPERSWSITSGRPGTAYCSSRWSASATGTALLIPATTTRRFILWWV